MSLADDIEPYVPPRNRGAVKKPKRKKRPLFTRGYEESRDRLSNNSYYSRSCFNCAYYYQEHGDKEEMCQNDRVLEYDMVVENNTVYCLHWKQSSSNSSESSMFNRRGRSLLD